MIKNKREIRTQMQKFKLDTKSHAYWELDKKKYEYFRIPSVTELCKPILNYSGISAEVLARAGTHGNNIHATFKLWWEGRSEEYELEEGNKIALETIEEWWDKEGIIKGEKFIIDVKTRKPYIPFDSVQLAAYEMLYNEGQLINGGNKDKFPRYCQESLLEEPIACPKRHFGGTPDLILGGSAILSPSSNSFEKYILYLKPFGGYEFVNAHRSQAKSVFLKLLKNWWDNHKAKNMVEKWKQTK